MKRWCFRACQKDVHSEWCKLFGSSFQVVGAVNEKVLDLVQIFYACYVCDQECAGKLNCV